ncbi:MAG: VWA domain-containing protein [Desulfobacteraceae bacterium]|jgi:predicted Holliday junction resolvase-like endonuclease
MKRYRKPIEVFSLSFLDVISCGFGAIILLLVLSLALEPLTISRMGTEINKKKAIIEEEYKEVTAQSQLLHQKINEKGRIINNIRNDLDQLEDELLQLQRKNSKIKGVVTEQSALHENLQVAMQDLTEEMKRLLSETEYKTPDKDAVIGGIPVDSEYIIFIIDTSGSMKRFAWPTVIRKVEQVLNVYPNVKGLQVVNDMGHYMFSSYAGKWIPDTPSRRREVINRLRTWDSYSNSSPVEGINHAIRVYFRKDQRISLYIFGDDFSSGNINTVVQEVNRINQASKTGETLVRIHAFGFPVLFNSEVLYANRAFSESRVRFAHLMRTLAERNSGSFVGLTSLK